MTIAFPAQVMVVEVGPRDGLQNEVARIDVAARATFVNALIAAGLRVVEAGAFVSPRWVPQMADTAEVLKAVPRRPHVKTPVLVPNRKGFDAARAAGAREIAIFTAASETFNKKNIDASIDESFERFQQFVGDARGDGMWIRGYVSTAFGCPYEGKVAPEKVEDVTARLWEAGCDEVSVGDTIGVAVPSQTAELMGRLRDAAPGRSLAVHMHDTRGVALANVLAALQVGIDVVDSSAGGLGGCPYAPGASGNLATEDLLYMLHGMGIETGVDLDAVAAASRALAPSLGHPLPSRYLQAVR
jgi:isopropylmalate/homocitrate/citramalate synthase